MVVFAFHFKFSNASSPSVNGGGLGTSKMSDLLVGPFFLQAEYLVPINCLKWMRMCMFTSSARLR